MVKLSWLTLLVVSCAGEPFNAFKATSENRDAASTDSYSLPLDSGVSTTDASGITPDASHSSGGMPAIPPNSSGGALSAGGASSGGSPPDAAPEPSPEAGLEAGPEVIVPCNPDNCAYSTYREPPCCRADNTCGVVFTGSGHACIVWR